ncbi:MAG: 4-hydroxythreonine-4-phosphate dehydrogenase PdxA [Deltaproteobacteria bacterium]|nr:4-hydroxythreonine-4-phosphate dehydrogenase PdxA [Deltaproteobacteria bacterium]
MKPIIGITQGEPTGIGPEIIAKSLQKSSLFRFCTPIVIGEPKYFRSLQKKVTIIPPLAAHSSSYGALTQASRLCLEKKIDAIVTAPVDKQRVSKEEGLVFLGHTEFFKKMCEKQFNHSFHSTMFFISPKEKLALVTTHLPLKKVSGALSKDVIQKTLLNVHLGLGALFKIRAPKLALLGLNPHAGEEGLLGQEEVRILKPAIQWARQQRICVEGPFSADSFFSNRWQLFDATIALYHDQGLGPFKARNFHSSTNITLGLPIIRTSVDHGVGYDIAGKNKASPLSMIAAIEWAIQLAKHKRSLPWGQNNLL